MHVFMDPSSRPSILPSSGSIRQVWSLTWPLMIGLVSSGLMIFFDRLILARFSATSLNAGATAGTASYLFLIIPFSLVAMSEVFTGRLQGEGEQRRIGNAVWQMIWVSLFSLPFFAASSFLAAPLLFSYSDFTDQERLYFQNLLLFAPFSCSTVALSGFFIGLGKPRSVTLSMILGNVLNIVLAILFTFGYGPIPQMGIKGAAYATGLSQVFQTTLLFFLFLKKENRDRYGTSQYAMQWTLIKEGIRVGLPTGLGHVMEVAAYVLFFQVIAAHQSSSLTIVAILQSIFILTSFLTEALSKSTTALIANFIGQRLPKNVYDKTLRSAGILHVLISASFALLFLSFPSFFLEFFLGEGSRAILVDPGLQESFLYASFWMCLFFMVDGLNWILTGALVAAFDTKWIFYVNTGVNWFVFAIPACLSISLFDKGPAFAWMNTFCAGIASFLLYFYRYSSGKWLTNQKMKQAMLDSSPSPTS